MGFLAVFRPLCAPLPRTAGGSKKASPCEARKGSRPSSNSYSILPETTYPRWLSSHQSSRWGPFPVLYGGPALALHLSFPGSDSGGVVGPSQLAEGHVARLIHVPLLRHLAGRSPSWGRLARAAPSLSNLARPFSRPQKYRRRAKPGSRRPARLISCRSPAGGLLVARPGLYSAKAAACSTPLWPMSA